ncbi:MAG: gamma-glutamyl-gamma-aminobutyrate hydrolase family protein [Rudaea sp.]
MNLPLIGIPSRTINDPVFGTRYGGLATYTRAVDLAGGAPLLIPLALSEDALHAIFDRLDGLLLAGGVDLDPASYGEEKAPYCEEVDAEKDATELALTRWALAADVPLLGICRGIQMLNVAAGGTLYQDIGHDVAGSLRHEHATGEPFNRIAHAVDLDPGSRLAGILGTAVLDVNSLHHQSVKHLAPGLKVVGRSPDGIVEAVEGTSGRFVAAVQFHPEWMLEDDTRMLDLFRAFVTSAADYAAARRAGGISAPAAITLRLSLDTENPLGRES